MRIFLLCLISSVLIACSSNDTSSPLPTQEPTKIAVTVVPTLTPILTPVPTATDEPTISPLPTESPTMVPTATVTPSPTNSPTPYYTPTIEGVKAYRITRGDTLNWLSIIWCNGQESRWVGWVALTNRLAKTDGRFTPIDDPDVIYEYALMAWDNCDGKTQ